MHLFFHLTLDTSGVSGNFLEHHAFCLVQGNWSYFPYIYIFLIYFLVNRRRDLFIIMTSETKLPVSKKKYLLNFTFITKISPILSYKFK